MLGLNYAGGLCASNQTHKYFLGLFSRTCLIHCCETFQAESERKRNAEWQKGKWFPLKPPCDVQLCSDSVPETTRFPYLQVNCGFLCSGSSSAMTAGSPLPSVTDSDGIWAVIALLSCRGCGFQRLLRHSDERSIVRKRLKEVKTWLLQCVAFTPSWSSWRPEIRLWCVTELIPAPAVNYHQLITQ